VVLSVMLGIYGIFSILAFVAYKLDERARKKCSPMIEEAEDVIANATIKGNKENDSAALIKKEEVEEDTVAILRKVELSFSEKTKILLARGFKAEHKFASVFAYDENFSSMS
jgi:hypothetical protein